MILSLFSLKCFTGHTLGNRGLPCGFPAPHKMSLFPRGKVHLSNRGRMTISLYSAQMLHWLHFRQQRASLWTPPSTRNVTFSHGKRTFMKLRSHDDIALFAQMLHWLHFRQHRAPLWIPCSTQDVTFSNGKRTSVKLRSLRCFAGCTLGTASLSVDCFLCVKAFWRPSFFIVGLHCPCTCSRC